MSGSDGRLETSSLGVDVQGLTAEERMSDTYFESFRVEGLGTSLTLDREPPPEQGSESSVVTELPDAIEKNLNDTLDKGDFDAIKKEVTPKTLSSCKTNTLFQAFQVNKKLRRLADRKGPEKDDIEKLAKSVDEFTLALVDPLKSNADTRHKFQSFFDSVVDEAIDTRQKKFISHPVVYDLLNYRWYRSFYSERKKSWQEPRRWGYLFLNLWTVFDIIFFPFLFAVFFVVHFLKKVSRKRRGAKICFVLTLREGTPSKEFDLIKSTMSHVVGKYGFHPTNYCVILHDKERLIGNIKFGQECSKSMLTELPKPNSPSSLCEDLKAACRAFESQNISNKAKQVLVLFLNDLKHRVKNEGDDSEKYRKELEKKQVNIVPIGIGQYAKLSELKRMQTKDGTASHFGEHELPETLGTAIIQGIEGKDIYENYMDYFTTPYFVFFRDTVSYLTLLGLHFAICLSPSTVSFSGLEWFVLIFFMGRILMEADQFISSKMERKRSDEPKQTKNEAGYIFPKKLISYFSDRWNVLDFIILTFYLITFILRIIVWRNFTDVSDNRLLAVSEYCYGFIAMLLTLRAFGQVMECIQGLGAIQIALFFIIWDVMPILWQFLAAILAFSLAMTKIYVAEKAYTLGKESAENLACSKSGMICWWNIATHLCWSLLGLADLDKLNSVDNPSVSLIHLLYIFFLIIAVILLVNMMIALLSNTYQQVQDNSLQEWSFKKAVTVRTYSTYHPIPVPFNLLSVPLIVLWNLGRKRSCKTWFVSSALDEEGKREGLDKVVKELESVYFQKFGYEFPLTEEKKIDQLVQENEGGRKITNQIVRQIFQPRGNNEKKLASGQRAWYYSPGIAIDGCLLTYLGPDFCYRCRNRGIRKKIHSAQFKYPFTIEMPRFEVLIQETGERRIIALGAVRESDGAVNNHYSCHAMPGWDDGTVGYHVYYGTIFENGCREKGREVKGAMAYRGDTIACEVDFKEQHEGKISVLFYLNDREVARCSMEYTSGQKLNPFVTLGFEGITVLTKMCHRDEDGDPSSRVTDVDLQAEFAVLKWLSEHTYGMQPALRREMEQLQIAREGLEIQLHEQMVMFSELKYLVQSLKELKEKPEEPGNVV
ncbi:uncharacterized protein LOC111329136 [Stylophora pistillata]|uniref:uncharacterized protein LOC111329136 n=1 Tax=Stylophora pistillata TaxID=50429 RepID=UPI000C03B9D1|nr:uncharacterized protein LOC111329136 [Stylophora pistillata]